MRQFTVAMIAVTMLAAPVARALTVDVYVDVAANAQYDAWWAQTTADVVAGGIVNMRNGTYPGTTEMDPYDEITYDTMDQGYRVHWIFWVPGATIAGLEGDFEVRYLVDWEGIDYYFDWALPALSEDPGPEDGWITPRRWEEYAGGVIGTGGWGWWASDNEAPPYDTGGTAYDETDAADVNALRRQVFDEQTYVLVEIRWRDAESSPWQYNRMPVSVRPPRYAGHVTGGGWIASPEGAFVPEPGLAGKASFSFWSRDGRHTHVPAARTQFKFRAGNMTFRGDACYWLVVEGAMAQFAGSGTVNREEGFTYILTAFDGRKRSGDPDRYRIEIWETETGQLVYDNGLGEPDTYETATPLGGGSIVIHKNMHDAGRFYTQPRE